MNIVIVGAGAMGGAIGALLSQAKNSVTLLDVSKETVEAVNRHGLRIQNKAGDVTIHRVPAVNHASEITGEIDLIVVFVKCYHTAAAIESVRNLIGPTTTILSLQNGWGNGPRIAALVGAEKVVLGVCYHSATVLAPGHVLHAGQGKTFIGELDGTLSPRVRAIAQTFSEAGIPVEPSGQVLREIWAKLALNVATLPTSSTTRITADRLLDTDEMQALMRALLREVVTVAQSQGIGLEFDERWSVITGLLAKLSPGSKGSMLQDVEKGRATEIDVMCGAIIEAGKQHRVETPYNHAMYCLIRALETTFPKT
jgi:2-dehydropantoate 2-reductase